jgi:DNA-binding NtrC family response regulator
MANAETQQGRPLRVLVVDDKLSIRTLIAELLRSNGYDVIDAANGRLAVDVLDRQAIDLVITDARMPELGGRGVFEHIEKHHPHLVDRLIVVTGHLQEDTEFFQTRTRVPILHKPFKLDELLDAVKKTADWHCPAPSGILEPHGGPDIVRPD